jgi:hypothetical protein
MTCAFFLVLLLFLLFLNYHWINGADVVAGNNQAKAPPVKYVLENLQSSNASNDRAIVSLLRRYIIRNSQQLLSREYSKYCNRKYIVGTYSCPRQVGNRIHEFLNTFLAAVILDRTLLWHYCSQKYCNQHVSESECTRFIHRYCHTMLATWK